MTYYLIAFNDEWVPELSQEQLRTASVRGNAVCDEMIEQGVFVFSDGALDRSTAVCSAEPRDGEPVFRDGPFVETEQHLGGFAVIDVADDEQARHWAGKIAVAVGWPQELHRFPYPGGRRT